MTGPVDEPCSIYILDIDGTLLRTHEIDNDCYWDAVQEVFGPRVLSRELIDYEHVSDSGILDQWCRQHLGRSPLEDEVRTLRGLFLDLIERQARAQPELFEPRPGLLHWLEERHAEPGTRLAIATGSWGNTAQFKLSASGLDRFGMALATADDAIRRTDIMTMALARLGSEYRVRHDAVTYVGDGPWDYHASMELGWAFIGIAEGQRAETLRDLGAQRVHADFRPLINGGEP